MIKDVLTPIEKMYFVDIDDCYKKIDSIKFYFERLNDDYKKIYKWYFFNQLCIVKDYKNNAIKSIFWEYICNVTDYENVDYSYLQFCLYREYLSNKKRTN